MVNVNGTNLMAKRHALNISLLIFIFLTGNTIAMSNNDTKFNWKATESGPENYPMEIIKGTFYYHNESEGLYIPTGATLVEGWGIMRSSHNVGPDLKPLPDRFDITYFSYAENKFYQGEFDLPYEKILSLFQQGVETDKDDPTYQRIMVGVAPGGAVSVWLLEHGVKEVFFGQAKEADIDWEKAMEIDADERIDAIKEEMEDSVGLEVIADIEKNGIPFHQWAEFRTQYNWLPKFSVSSSPKNFAMVFYNGESQRYSLPYEQIFTNTHHPVPKTIRFHSAVIGQEKIPLFIIHFNQYEIMDAFTRLGKNQQPLQLEFHPKLPKNMTEIILRNDKETIALKKFTVEEF